MGEREYIELIQEIRDKLNEENANEGIKLLDTLFEIKPVRSIWFAAKAEAMYKAKYKADEIYALLDGKMKALYDYENLCDILKMYIRLAEDSGDTVEKKRLLFVLNQVQSVPTEEGISFIENTYSETDALYVRFLDDNISEEIITKIIEQCYIQQDFVLYLLFDIFNRKLCDGDSIVRTWVKNFPNTGYLEEKFNDNEQNVFIILADDEHNLLECTVVAKLLNMLGKKVFLLDCPLQVEVENEIDMEDTLTISVENLEEYDNQIVIHPIEVRCKDEVFGDNRDYIIDYINKTYCPKQQSTVLCSGYLMDDLCQRDILRRQMGRLYDFREEFTEKGLTFGWSGDYLAYISGIYGIDAREAVEQSSECDFSIVIPVRNSAATLRYTLKTCLEQSYKGDYEIIISDNSTMVGSGIYELCQELNDPRIVYIKTPRDLCLSKSFEYAYLHTKGKYIFSIGADDGVLPWALETLAQIVEEYPEDEIIQWERGFYAWPGFNEGQQNQFILPCSYQKGKYNPYYRSKINCIATVLKEPQQMYSLPLLYINSCFERSYLRTLLKKTGKLWDGGSQDIYMGIVTACICPQILNLKYPLTIAGMSSASIGATSAEAKKDNKELEKCTQEFEKTSNVGGFCRSYIERFLPHIGSDVSALYNSILRGVTVGVLPESYLNEIFDWKDFFIQLSAGIGYQDIAFDCIVQEMRYDAAKHGEEFLKWFDETIYHDLMQPKCIDKKKAEQQKNQKAYQTGRLDNGGVVLDASEYGVENIYDAVKLFEKLSGL